MLIWGHFRHEGAALPVGLLLAGAGAIPPGASLGDDPLTTLGTGRREPLRFGSTAGAPFPLRVGLAGFTGFHPPIVGNEGLPAPADHPPVFRHFLGVSSAAPGIDRGLGLVQPAPWPTIKICPWCSMRRPMNSGMMIILQGGRLTDRQKPILSRFQHLSRIIIQSNDNFLTV